MEFEIKKKFNLSYEDLASWLTMRACYNGLPKHPFNNSLLTRKVVEEIFYRHNSTNSSVPIFHRYSPAEANEIVSFNKLFDKEQTNCYNHYSLKFKENTKRASQHRHYLLTSDVNTLPQFPITYISLSPKDEFKYSISIPEFNYRELSCRYTSCVCCNKLNKKHVIDYDESDPNKQCLEFDLEELLAYPALKRKLEPGKKDDIKKNITISPDDSVKELKGKIEKSFMYNRPNHPYYPGQSKTDLENWIAEHLAVCPLKGNCADVWTYAMLKSNLEEELPRNPICPYYKITQKTVCIKCDELKRSGFNFGNINCNHKDKYTYETKPEDSKPEDSKPEDSKFKSNDYDYNVTEKDFVNIPKMFDNKVENKKILLDELKKIK